MQIAEVEIGKKYGLWIVLGVKHTATGRIANADLIEVTVIRKGQKKVRVKSYDQEYWIYPIDLKPHWNN